MTDYELIQRFQNGDKNAFDDLVKRHYPNSFQFFMRMFRDEMEANDLCQETYIKVYKGLKKFRFQAEFTTWLYRISVNVANSYLRKRRIREVLNWDTEWEQMSDKNDEWEPDGLLYLWKAIAKLSKKQKMVIILRIFQELPFKEIAGVLGMTENSAKVNYHHAIKSLKTIFGEE